MIWRTELRATVVAGAVGANCGEANLTHCAQTAATLSACSSRQLPPCTPLSSTPLSAPLWQPSARTLSAPSRHLAPYPSTHALPLDTPLCTFLSSSTLATTSATPSPLPSSQPPSVPHTLSHHLHSKHISFYLHPPTPLIHPFRPRVPSRTHTGLRVSLSRYDLYHAHLVVNRDLDVAALLFHAMEYPQQSPAFPHNLGFCQADSPLVFQPATFPFRNALWVLPLDAPAKASLWLLDAREPSIVWEQLLNPWNRPLYTADEARLGDVVADVYLVGATPLAWYPFNRTPVVQGGMT